MKNNGLQNEKDIIDVLDGKLYKQLPEFWKNRIRQLYHDIKDDDKIECVKCVYNQKADIAIRINDKKFSISIKSGYFVSVHNESISSFCYFLKSLGISDDLIRVLKLYHYGDGTVNGTGSVHYPVEELKIKYAKEIEEFNKEVNKKDILRKIVIRFLCTGTPYQGGYASHLYSGTYIFGSLIDMKTMVEYICEGYSYQANAIYFGPFIYTPAYRGLENFDETNVKRYYINIKWPSLNRDMRDAKLWYFKKREERLKEIAVEEEKNKMQSEN